MIGCSHCATFGRWAQPHAGLPVCQWCNRFRATYGKLPSKPLVNAHHEGKPITAKMLAAVNAQEKATPLRRKPRTFVPHK